MKDYSLSSKINAELEKRLNYSKDKSIDDFSIIGYGSRSRKTNDYPAI